MAKLWQGYSEIVSIVWITGSLSVAVPVICSQIVLKYKYVAQQQEPRMYGGSRLDNWSLGQRRHQRTHFRAYAFRKSNSNSTDQLCNFITLWLTHWLSQSVSDGPCPALLRSSQKVRTIWGYQYKIFLAWGPLCLSFHCSPPITIMFAIKAHSQTVSPHLLYIFRCKQKQGLQPHLKNTPPVYV